MKTAEEIFYKHVEGVGTKESIIKAMEEHTNLTLEQLVQDNMTICQEREDLKIRIEKLEKSLAKIFKYMDDGVIVRDISRDYEFDWVMKMIRLTMDLKEAHELLPKQP